MDLKSLDKRDSRDLLLEILQKVPEVPKDLRDKLVERAEGNPLYLEELVKMLLDDHVILKESDEVWRIETSRLDNLNVPLTLAGLMEERFDTLLYPEKITLQRASVIGRTFYDKALEAIDQIDDTHLSDLPALLEKLAEREFIYQRETSAFKGSTEYIFASAMLRDMLYERLLERQRRVYHTGAAVWLEQLERHGDYLPVIAEHYEKAGDMAQAAAFLRQAGEVAVLRGTSRESIDFFQRGLAVLADVAPEVRLPLLLGLGESYNQQGEIEPARESLQQALALARTINSPEGIANTLYQLSLTETTYGDYAAAQTCLDEALPLARACLSQQLLANVLYGLANVNFRIGNYDTSYAAAHECKTLCEVIGDDVLRIYALNRMATGVVDHPSRHDEGERYLQEALELARRIGHRDGEQIILGNLGWWAVEREDWAAVISYTEASLGLARELGSVLGIAVWANNLAECYLNSGQPEKSPPFLLEALRSAIQSTAVAWILTSVNTAGRWKIIRGETAAGLKLFGLAHYHPASGQDSVQDGISWLKKHRDKIPLTDAEMEAAMEAGKDLDIDIVVEEVLKELSG